MFSVQKMNIMLIKCTCHITHSISSISFKQHDIERGSCRKESAKLKPKCCRVGGLNPRPTDYQYFP